MKDLGRPTGLDAVGQVQRRQQGRVHRLIGPAPQPGVLLHPPTGEIHVHQPFVDLDDAVLHAGGHAQLLALHRQRQRGLHVAGDFHPVKLHQRTQDGHDDRAGTGQPHLAGNVALVAKREVAIVQPTAFLPAILGKTLHRRLHQPQAAVIAVQADLADQLVQRAVAAFILPAGHQLQAVGFRQRRLGPEVPHDDRQRLAEIAVRRVADQAGPGVCSLADRAHVEDHLNVAARQAEVASS